MLARLRDRPLESLICCNPECPSEGKARPGLLKVRYLRSKGTIRYLRCTECGTEFSERKGTPLFDLRLPEEKAFEVLRHVAEGCGVRGTSRLCGVKTGTVTRLVVRCGEHFKLWHDTHVKDVAVHEAQMDEKWSFVGKKTEELQPR
jgi:transposase-like protein